MSAFGEGIDNYSERPYIGLFPDVLLAADDFGGHIVGGSADDGHFLFFVG